MLRVEGSIPTCICRCKLKCSPLVPHFKVFLYWKVFLTKMWLCATRILEWLRVALVGNKLNTKLSLAIVMKIIKPHLKLTCHVFYIFYREKKSCQNLFFWWYFFFIVHNNFTKNRAYSSSLLHAIIARSHLPFFKILQILYTFAQIFKYFAVFYPFIIIFIFFCTFEKSHACPYFLE